MREPNDDENILEQRLRTLYRRSFAPLPDAKIVWARVQPELDQAERHEPEVTRRPKYISALVTLLVSGWRRVPVRRQAGYPLRGNPASEERVNVKRPGEVMTRRRLGHGLEIAIALLLVMGLALGWFAVTRWRSAQGGGRFLYTYMSQPGEYGYDSHWTPDGKHFVFVILNVITNQYSFRVWDAASGVARETLTARLPASEVGRSMLVSPDGQYALIRVSGTNPRAWMIKLADILTGEVRLIYQGVYSGQDATDLPAAAFAGNSKAVAFVGADKRVYIWNIAMGQMQVKTDPLVLSLTNSVQQFAWSPDNTRVIIKSAPQGKTKPARLQVLSAETGRTLLHFADTPEITPATQYQNERNGFAGLSPDGTRILTYNQRTGVLTERESHTLKILQTFPVKVGLPGSGGYVVFWEANGTRVLWQNYSSLYIWDANTGKPVLTFAMSSTDSRLVVPSSGRYITRTQAGNHLEIWDMVTGKKVRSMAFSLKQPFALVWSADEKYLDLRGEDQQGQVFDAFSGETVLNYAADAALMAPDGQMAALQTHLPPYQASLDQWQVLIQIQSIG